MGPLKKLKFNLARLPSSSIPCEQTEDIERFRVSEITGQIFQLIEDSSMQ